MISTRENSAECRSAILSRVQKFFQAGGVMDRACAREAFAFEIRPQQMAMADAVARTIMEPEHLAVEAGTGVGKTFAYLVPLILLALEKKEPVAVSTRTINLQEQIVFKDIPFLQRHMGLKFDAVLCKGRGNYLCRRRLERARRMSGDLFRKSQERELNRILRWADTTEDGSLSDFSAPSFPNAECRMQNAEGGSQGTPPAAGSVIRNPQSRATRDQSATCPASGGVRNQYFPQPAPDVWNQVCSEHDNCLSRKCPHYGRCFLMKARSRAFAADILILNHHLFFSDLALRQEGVALLPEFKTLVLDEANCLEATASEHLGLRLSQAGIEHWLRRLYVPESGKGLLAALKESDLAHAVSGAWDDVERFFLEIKRWANLAGRETRRVVGAPLEMSVFLGERLTAVIHQVDRRADMLEDPDVKAELKTITRRGLEIRDSLDVFLTQSQANHVYWIELEGVRRRQFVLHSAPVEVGPILETLLFQQFQSVIMTSATLAVAGEQRSRSERDKLAPPQAGSEVPLVAGSTCLPRGSRGPAAGGVRGQRKTKNEEPKNSASPLAYFLNRVGARPCQELVVGSPFNFSRQMRVYIAGDMPDPKATDAFRAAAIPAVRQFVAQTQGRAFVLFTSAEMMRTVAKQLRPFVEANGLMLIVQGEGIPRHRMLDEFKQNGSAVLFGLDSFWMGVDVRGEALSNVIIARLPFAVPDEPVTKARMDRIREQGGDPFRDYSLPEAILKFRQGVGRLIRTAADEGIIVVLDSRIVTRWYGRLFLAAIPECPVEVVSVSGEQPALSAVEG